MRKILLVILSIAVLGALTAWAGEGLRLREVMRGLEADMQAIMRGISRGDMKSVESWARAIAGHEKPPMEERKKIAAFLKEDAGSFQKADAKVHDTALRLAEAARKGDRKAVVETYGALLDGCVNCHSRYRAPIVKHFYAGEAAVSLGKDRKAALMAEAMEVVKRFASRLKPEMKKAMKSGGPVNAIRVCSVMAPAIAREVSRETGWKIRRVSLRPRNPGTATPDAWEEKVLRRFDERRAKGEDAAGMVYGEVVDGRFRFMKAQKVVPLCLKCHGANIAPEVKKVLSERYPDDKATGYGLGDVRGAFSLSKGL